MSLNTWGRPSKAKNSTQERRRREFKQVEWAEMSVRVICVRRIAAGGKWKVYKIVVRPDVMHGLEMMALNKRLEAELEVEELKMLRLRTDTIRNDFGNKVERRSVLCTGESVL